MSSMVTRHSWVISCWCSPIRYRQGVTMVGNNIRWLLSVMLLSACGSAAPLPGEDSNGQGNSVADEHTLTTATEGKPFGATCSMKSDAANTKDADSEPWIAFRMVVEKGGAECASHLCALVDSVDHSPAVPFCTKECKSDADCSHSSPSCAPGYGCRFADRFEAGYCACR